MIRGSHLPDRPQHQLHKFLHGVLLVLRVLPAAGAKDGYILSFESIYEKIDEMLELGGTGVLLQGGLHPDLQIGYYENLLRSLKQRYRKCICTAFRRRKFCASRK